MVIISFRMFGQLVQQSEFVALTQQKSQSNHMRNAVLHLIDTIVMLTCFILRGNALSFFFFLHLRLGLCYNPV